MHIFHNSNDRELPLLLGTAIIIGSCHFYQELQFQADYFLWTVKVGTSPPPALTLITGWSEILVIEPL